MMTTEGTTSDSAARSAIASAIGKTYFQSDYLGSVLFADNEQGEILRYIERDSWGNTELPVLFDMNTAGVENSIQFTSHPYDTVIGKYFAEARFYDAETGRFMTKDPIKTGVNLYPYAQNNPVKLIDPDGESPLSFIAAIGGAVTGGAYGALAYFDEQQKQHEKFNLLDFAKTTLKSAGIGGAKMLLASVVPGYGTGLLAEIGLGVTGNQAKNMVTGKGNFTDAVKSTMDDYFGIDRGSLFPAKPRPAKEQATAGAGRRTSNTGTGKNGTGNAQNNDFTKRRNTSPYKPSSVTDSIASSVRPVTIPSANPTVDSRNPKEACGNGSNYGYGAGSAGPLKTVPGTNNIVKDVIRSTIEITAGVVATAVVGTVLGVGASKLLRALKPVGRGIVQGALSAGKNLFKGIFWKKSKNGGSADKPLLDYNLQFFGGNDSVRVRNFRVGDLYEYTIEVNGVKIDALAEVQIDGNKLILKDLVIYAEGGDIPNQIGASEFKNWLNIIKIQAKEQGFGQLQIIGQRAENSTSANPGNIINRVFKLR